MSERSVLSNLRLVTLDGDAPDLTPVADGLIVVENGAIAYAGPAGGYSGDTSGSTDMGGALALPGLVACHNTILWVGEGADGPCTDGDSYRELARSVAASTSSAEESALYEALRSRCAALARSGVTACELKSGFGTSPEEELRLAGILRCFADEAKMRTTVTLFIGHQFPEDEDQDDVLAHIETEIVPKTYELGYADAVEVFCDDDGALDLDACSTILELYYKKKTPSRVACDRFDDSAGATLPASFYSRAATYLNCTDETGLESLATVGTAALLVPETLDADAASGLVESVRAAGGRIALCSESGPEGQVDLLGAMRMGKDKCGLTTDECILGVTVRAAKILGMSDTAGVLAAGRPADIAFFDAADCDDLLANGSTRCTGVMHSGTLEQFN